MRRSLALATVLVLCSTVQLFAVGEARITGKVLDTAGAPIADATIDVSATEAKNWHQTFKTNKKGEYSVFVLDGTIHYKFRVAKDGYVPYEETMKLKLIPEKNEHEFKLSKAGEGQPAEGGQQIQTQQAKPDPAVTAYNEGAGLANQGDDAGAIAKFEEAVKLNDQLGAGYSALTKLYAKTKNWSKVIENGEVRVLDQQALARRCACRESEGAGALGGVDRAFALGGHRLRLCARQYFSGL